MRRVDEAVREVLGDVLQRELKDPRIGFATVTAVRTSADLRHARVLISVLPSEDADPADTIAGLTSAHGYIQRRVGEELKLRNTPTLKFELDDTIDRAMRIQELLDDPPPPAVDGDDGPAADDQRPSAGGEPGR